MENIKTLMENAAQEAELTNRLDALLLQKREADRRAYDLKWNKFRQDEDVRKLEKFSIANLFAELLGKKEEKLEQEQKEAYEAALRYESALKSLEDLEREIAEVREALKPLKGAGAKYRQAVTEAAAKLKGTDTEEGRRVLELTEELQRLKVQQKEISEARRAGSSALGCADRVLAKLNKAMGWSTWDVMGGGLISDMEKHRYLDEAQGEIHTLQSCLRRFRTELYDVRIDADLHVNIEGFERFADYFFDGLLADFSVRNRISESISRINSTKTRINSAMTRLNALDNSVGCKIEGIRSQIEGIVTGAI